MKKIILAFSVLFIFCALISVGCKKTTEPSPHAPNAPSTPETPNIPEDPFIHPGTFTYVIENGLPTITSITPNSEGIAIIPETIDGHSIARIADEAAKNVTEIKFVVIPDSVITIGRNAFEGTSLIAAWLPQNVPFVFENAFPENAVTYVPYTAGYVPSAYTQALATATALPFSLNVGAVSSYTGTNTFLYIPPKVHGMTVTAIGYGAFYGCTNLISVNAPSVTAMSNLAFENCSNLVSAHFPLVTEISYRAFYDCSNLANAHFPLATAINECAFQNCSSLINAHFPLTTAISHHAFQNCSSLINAHFPLTTAISYQAFQNCSSLTTAAFGAVTNIGAIAFQNCAALQTVTINNSTPPDIADDAFADTPSNKALRVPAGAKNAYETEDWGTTHKFKTIMNI